MSASCISASSSSDLNGLSEKSSLAPSRSLISLMVLRYFALTSKAIKSMPSNLTTTRSPRLSVLAVVSVSTKGKCSRRASTG